MLCGLGKVQETLACPNHQTTFTQNIHGKVYEARVRSAMHHGSEIWGRKEPELRGLCRSDRAMSHWICGIKDRDETPSLSFTTTETWHRGHYIGPLLSATQIVWLCTTVRTAIKLESYVFVLRKVAAL